MINKEIYGKCAQFLEAVINLLDDNNMHADIKEQLKGFYSNFKVKAEKYECKK